MVTDREQRQTNGAGASGAGAATIDPPGSAMVTSPFLDEVAAKIRAKPVPWEGYQRAGLVSMDELAMIKKVDRQSKKKVDEVYDQEGEAYAKLYLNLIAKLSRVDTLQHILVLVSDMVADREDRVALFKKAASSSDPAALYRPFLKLLDSPDDFVQLKAVHLITLLASSPTPPAPTRDVLGRLLTTLSALVHSTDANKHDVAIQCLAGLVSRKEYRGEVWKFDGERSFLSGLLKILQGTSNPQTQYQVIFCIWLLTFEDEVAARINSTYNIIPLLTDIARTAVKEKVVRVVMATFRNLIAKAPDANIPAMLGSKVLPLTKNLLTRKWSDEEVEEDVSFVRDQLAEAVKGMSTYDEYASELASGRLSWDNPVHESVDFWKENAAKLNEKDGEGIKRLVEILRTSQDPEVLAVACRDIGQYIKFYEQGRSKLNDLDAKTRAMELMSHKDPKTQYEALTLTQRLVSHSWV